MLAILSILAAVQSSVVLADTRPAGTTLDPRNIAHGWVIPDEGYCDQPYVVITRDGNWLCTLTTGKGREGQKGQHIVSTISTDCGRTWSPLTDIEPADGPEASWVMPLIVPSGRVYVFYNYNGDRVNRLGDKVGIRADTLGWYVYKYSDDNGCSWSTKRYRLPIRQTSFDLANAFKGQVRMFWGIGKPVVVGDKVFFGFSKVNHPDMTASEGWFMRSDNLLTESDPDKHQWRMLPDGDVGLRSIAGPIAEEQNLVGLSNGSLYTMYRTVEGYACHAYSSDGGKTWTPTHFAEYTPGGSLIKNPRACPRLWKAANGKYLFWFHNNSLRDFYGRNPAWIVGGVERDGRVYWSQPEILLYDTKDDARISYPDLIEQDGKYWITETQKTVARVHEIDATLLDGMWRQGLDREVSLRGLIHTAGRMRILAGTVRLPTIPPLKKGTGLTLEFRLSLDQATPATLWDSRDSSGKGIVIKLIEDGTASIEMNDGKTSVSWNSDAGMLPSGRPHHLCIVVDSLARVITVIIDGVLCDGGIARPYGWCRFSPELDDVNGNREVRLAKGFKGKLDLLRVYNRPLRTSEVVSNYRAGG